jgi:hypothetical protein
MNGSTVMTSWGVFRGLHVVRVNSSLHAPPLSHHWVIKRNDQSLRYESDFFIQYIFYYFSEVMTPAMVSIDFVTYLFLMFRLFLGMTLHMHGRL